VQLEVQIMLQQSVFRMFSWAFCQPNALILGCPLSYFPLSSADRSSC
jgi:hypothetical protein